MLIAMWYPSIWIRRLFLPTAWIADESRCCVTGDNVFWVISYLYYFILFLCIWPIHVFLLFIFYYCIRIIMVYTMHVLYLFFFFYLCYHPTRVGSAIRILFLHSSSFLTILYNAYIWKNKNRIQIWVIVRNVPHVVRRPLCRGFKYCIYKYVWICMIVLFIIICFNINNVHIHTYLCFSLCLWSTAWWNG